MKKYLLALSLSAMLLAGCSQQADPVEDIEEPEVMDAATLKEKVEAPASYISVTNESIKNFVPTCDAYTEEYAQKVKDGDVKRLFLYSSGDYALQLYSTPNYDSWTEADFTKVSACGELGSVTPVKIAGDSVLWSYPHCTAGVKPAETDAGYQDFTGCMAVETLLNEYLAM